jgi:hypothetical protein
VSAELAFVMLIYMVYTISNAKFVAQLRFSSVHWFI